MIKLVINNTPKSPKDCPFYAYKKILREGHQALEVCSCTIGANLEHECKAFENSRFDCPYLVVRPDWM